MLVIKNSTDLLKYLETRKTMVQSQIKIMLPGDSRGNVVGQTYAFEEAIRAVQALIESEVSRPIESENREPEKSFVSDE